MSYKQKFFIYILFFLIYLYIGSGSSPLFETTEGRYAEIAREMYINHNYLVPTFNEITHFHKPPLTYWMMTLGMKMFGPNPFGLRFFGCIASIIGLIATFFTAKLFLKDDKYAYFATLVLSSSLLYIIVSRLLATDVYLLAFTTSSLYFLFRQIFHKKSLLNTCFYALFLGLAFLTKGPVVFIFTLIPYFICKLFFSNHRKVFSLNDILLGLLIFFLIALPWYIVVMFKYPNLFHYFLGEQIVERITINKFNRDAPFYYFIPTILITFFPFVLYLIKGSIKYKSLPKDQLILYIYILIPFLIFSVNRAKLITYIVPFYGLASIITTYVISHFRSKIIDFLSYFFLIAMHVAAILLLIFYFDTSSLPINRSFIISLWIFGILISIVFIAFKRKAYFFNTSYLLLLLMFFPYILSAYVGDQIKGYKSLSTEINKIDPTKKLEVITYKAFIPSISFYRNKTTIVAFYNGRELQFEKSDRYKKYLVNDKDSLSSLLNKLGKFFIVTSPQNIEDFKKEYSCNCNLIAIQREHSAYICKKNNSTIKKL
jgi:4-amino-4-deoxy-L-arabinose transferase